MTTNKARRITTCLTIALCVTLGSLMTTAATIPEPQSQRVTTTPSYTTIDLANATDPLGVLQCEAISINNHGEVVGFEYLNESIYRSLYWDQNGTATILENYADDNSSRPYMIDDNGLILGWSANVTYEHMGGWIQLHMNQTAVTWKDHQITNMNDEVTGGDPLDLYYCMDINDAGIIIGSGAPIGHIPPPWFPNGYILNRRTVTDMGDATYPVAINNHNHIVGYTEQDYVCAYEWINDTAINLNDHPSIHGIYSQALDINDNNIIVGTAQMAPSLDVEPIIWIDHTPTRITTTPAQRYFGYATAINKKDAVVGWYIDTNDTNAQYKAFLWQDGQITILNDLLPPEQHWEDIYPADINDRGQIVGRGYRTNIGWRAFLMTSPFPELDIQIAGGRGITASIKNIGHAPATDIAWTITLEGGLILKGRNTTGTFTTIPPGSTAEIAARPIIGLGKTTITMHVDTQEAIEATKTIPGFVLLFYTFIQ